MSILSSICRVPVILPPSSSAAVVSGSAMLGRYAAEVREVLGDKEITSMEQAKQAGKKMKERLWEIMVRDSHHTLDFPSPNLTSLALQIDMTPAGKRIVPEAGKKEMALFDVKYAIYKESIEVQRRWRKMVDDVAGDEGLAE